MASSEGDVPMSLGDHLHELRRRIVPPLIVLGLGFIVAFHYQGVLKQVFVWPLHRAIEMAGPEVAARAGLPSDGSWRILKTFAISESAWVSVSVSFWAAFLVAMPVLVYQIYRFIAVGLTSKERNFGFLLVPTGMACFFLGVTLGFFYGIPVTYWWFIDWAANDPVASFELRLSDYRDSFVFYTLCFGGAFLIPWVVVVLCRTGLVTPAKIALARKYVFMGVTVFAGIVAPPDITSMVVLMVPSYLLFEIGLLWARASVWAARRRGDMKPLSQGPA